MNSMHDSKQNTVLIRGHIQVARLAFRLGEYHSAYRNLNSALYEIEQAGTSAMDDLLAHELKHLIGKVQVSLRMYEEAEMSFRGAIEFAEQRPSLPNCLIISDKRHLADCVRLRHRYEEAEKLYHGCIEMLKDIDTPEENQLPKAYLGLAQVYIDSQRLDLADKAIDMALSRFETHPGNRSFWTGRALVTQARLRWAQNRQAESKEILQQALNILEPLVGPHHPIRALALRRLANVISWEGHERPATDIFTDLKEVEKYLRDHDA